MCPWPYSVILQRGYICCAVYEDEGGVALQFNENPSRCPEDESTVCPSFPDQLCHQSGE